MGAISSVADRLAKTLDDKGLTVAQLLHALEGKGHAAIMAVLSIPFCFPIQLPGLSTPFGIILIFSGLRISFGQVPWLPGWLLVREIPKIRFGPVARIAMDCGTRGEDFASASLRTLSQPHPPPCARIVGGVSGHSFGPAVASPV